MIEKLKSFGEASKNIVLYVLIPLFVVAAFISRLLGKEQSLKEELESVKAEEKMRELDSEKKQIDSLADTLTAEYKRKRDDYLRGSSGGVRQGDAGPTGPDPDKG